MAKIYSAAPTPFTSVGLLDEESFGKMLEYNIESGISGFFLSGNMGEWSQYGLEVRTRLAASAREVIGGRAEILMGITETGLHKTQKTMEALSPYAPDSYVVMLPPRNMSHYAPLDYLTNILEAADRPVYYYHCPPANGVTLGIPEFAELVTHPKLKGIKNSSGNVGVRRDLLMLKQKHPFLLLEGHEWAIDEAVMLGCDGALCGMACLGGKLMCRIAALAESGNMPMAMCEQHKLIDIFHGIYGIRVDKSQNSLKYAMRKMGFFASDHCLLKSDAELTDDDRRRVDACLEKYAEEF